MQVTAPAVNTWMGQRLAGQRAPSTRAAAAAARPSRPRRPLPAHLQHAARPAAAREHLKDA
jgi:hypothetical protein